MIDVRANGDTSLRVSEERNAALESASYAPNGVSVYCFPFLAGILFIFTDHMVEDTLPEEEVRLTSQQVDVRLCLLPED